MGVPRTPGYQDINAFLRSVDFSAFNLHDKRPALIQRIKELQPDASNRAIAEAIGVSTMTVGRDLQAVTNVTPEPQPAADHTGVPEEVVTNVTAEDELMLESTGVKEDTATVIDEDEEDEVMEEKDELPDFLDGDDWTMVPPHGGPWGLRAREG